MASTGVSAEASVSLPPRENIIRAVMPGVELRSDDNGTKTLFGHFARFNEWTEIRSAWEGHFLERISPGAFTKTLNENRDNIKVLFDHGHDPSIGNKPLGSIRDVGQDDDGAFYEVDLFDASYVRDLIPALEAKTLGASFRFRVMREEFDKKPGKSDHNPDGLPERTIKEASVAEFGPVTFPAYAGATAGVRSLTDEHIVRQLLQDPARLRDLLLNFLPPGNEQGGGEATPPAENRAEHDAHPVDARRIHVPLFGLNEETPTWRI